MPAAFDFATATVPEAGQELERLARELTVENTPETLTTFEQVFRAYPHLHPAVNKVEVLCATMAQLAHERGGEGDTAFDSEAYRKQAFPLLRFTAPIYEREVQPR